MSLGAVAALVNSAGDGSLETLDDLDAFYETWQFTGSRRRSRAELEAVRALRPRLRPVWEAGEDDAVRIVNGLLREFDALPQLVNHHEWGYHLHATPADSPLAARIAVEAAMAFVDVIRAGELDRLRVCAAEDCQDVLVDLSKNRSRRFCEKGCGNRANVAAYRARRAASG